VFSRHLRFPDPLMTGQLLAYVTKMPDEESLRRVFMMLTEDAGVSLGLDRHGPFPGHGLMDNVAIAPRQ
jgi:hypothetical protein